MFFPVGDTPNPPRFTAWVNWALIAANVAIFVRYTLPLSMQPVDPTDPLLPAYLELLRGSLPPGTSLRAVVSQITAYDLLVFEHGYKPGARELSDLFSAMFLHAGFAHLGGNMLFLWIYGDNVEHRLGRVRYLLVYLLTGVAASEGFALLAAGSLTPMIGASGAISGVLGLYFVLFPRNRVKVFVFLFPLIMTTVLIPARWVLGAYVLFDNLMPLFAGARTGVAYGAHLGGFVAGALVAVWGARVAWSVPRRRRAASPSRTEQAYDLLEQGLAHIEERDYTAAYHALIAAIERDPRGPAATEAFEILQSLRGRF